MTNHPPQPVLKKREARPSPRANSPQPNGNQSNSKLDVSFEQDIGSSTKRRFLEDACQAQALCTAGGLELHLAVVADGIGGENSGERAARLTVETIFEHCQQSAGSNIPQMLQEGIEQANAAVYAEGRGERHKRDMGSTVTAVAIHKGRLYLAHAGDSRAYLVRGKKVMQLTQDHTWAYEVVRAGKLKPADAARNPRAGELVRSIGYEPKIQVDLGIRLRGDESDQEALGNQGLALKPGDSVVVCSDGLIKSKANGRGNYVEPEEIARTVESNSANKAARTLLSLALQRNVDDNVSVIVIEVPMGGVTELTKRVRQSPLAVGGLGVLLTAAVLVFGFVTFGQDLIVGNSATPTPRVPLPNMAYVQYIYGEGRATYVTNRMARPDNLLSDSFVDSGIGSIVRTDNATSVKFFLTQALVVWLGPGSELEIRELASEQPGASRTEVKLINGIMLTILTAELPAGETFRVIGDPGHVAQVMGSVMGVRYDKNFQTFDVDCLEGHCMNDGKSLTDCEWVHSESDLVPGPVGFANQSWYAFVEKNEKLPTHCIPTATPTNGPTATPTRRPKPPVLVSPTEMPLTSTPAPSLTSTEIGGPGPGPGPSEPTDAPKAPTNTPVTPKLACSDTLDNDGDGKIDMADPGCLGSTDNDETDPPPSPQCSDGSDNDGDGKIDMADPGCSGSTDDDETDPPPSPQCSDGSDNDGDGKIDMADPGCSGPTDNDETDPPPSPQCSDGSDNDGDGKIDMADPGCLGSTDNDETDPPPSLQCSDGSDNDGDGKIDMADPGCSGSTDDDETDPPPSLQCSDGSDNDGDGKIDMADPGCSGSTDNDETDPPPSPQCSDGSDNDGDGKIDMADPGCSGPTDNDETDLPPPPSACSDGNDNDNDGQVDMADPGCSGSTDNDETDPLPL